MIICFTHAGRQSQAWARHITNLKFSILLSESKGREETKKLYSNLELKVYSTLCLLLVEWYCMYWNNTNCILIYDCFYNHFIKKILKSIDHILILTYVANPKLHLFLVFSLVYYLLKTQEGKKNLLGASISRSIFGAL